MGSKKLGIMQHSVFSIFILIVAVGTALGEIRCGVGSPDINTETSCPTSNYCATLTTTTAGVSATAIGCDTITNGLNQNGIDLRCKTIGNGCKSNTIVGVKTEVCCCNTPLCNKNTLTTTTKKTSNNNNYKKTSYNKWFNSFANVCSPLVWNGHHGIFIKEEIYIINFQFLCTYVKCNYLCFL